VQGFDGAVPRSSFRTTSTGFSWRSRCAKSGEAEIQILEPVGRNTAPAVAVVALHLQSRHPDACMLVLPSDHLIRDVPAFHAAIATALPLAAGGSLVTFGITRAGAGHGIRLHRTRRPGSRKRAQLPRAALRGEPDLETARRYFSTTGFLEQRMFALRPRRFLEELSASAQRF